MTTTHPTTAPVLSTPESHVFEDPTELTGFPNVVKLSHEQLYITYEIERTIREIREGKWKRVALQFPDQMLVDAPRVYRELVFGLRKARKNEDVIEKGEVRVNGQDTNEQAVEVDVLKLSLNGQEGEQEKLCILGDTSYGACCVDEIAAEHVDAEVVVHYGRSCLSPTARLPVIYVFTEGSVDVQGLVDVFRETYQEKGGKILLMADVPFACHIPRIHEALAAEGYSGIFATEVIHDPSSVLPNRTVPKGVTGLQDYQLFHIGQPPTALLLTLSSRVGDIHVCPADMPGPTGKAVLASSKMALRRRYALLTSLSTVSIYGILINTLSVKHYLEILEHVKKQISAAGKKSYTFVVGKINAAKIANFSEIGGWVVIGCWESSLVESKEFYRPLITPFELGLALQDDSQRVWTGEWEADFEGTLAKGVVQRKKAINEEEYLNGDMDSESESEAPEFDLRTGRYVSHSRPMHTANRQVQIESDQQAAPASSKTMIKRANGDLAHVGGVVSPGAEYLRTARTWQGLGSDFSVAYEGVGETGGSVVEQGRRGLARGYVVGDDSERR
ncbi:diphthamide biosynthesis protein 2 [Venturia nashicola]|uniref:2-(3-amino-3-carboxypropyl)histidine synthase subunit 2 n=1 Tax=Venturia nashicola TaxID=86259 RepID=A0A4Z1P864_9PEZI|nr:diphthamide biosynthesis protein 2 [Venturia nashicola]